MFLIIPFMSLLARAAGDRWFGQTKVWGVLFGLCFGYAVYINTGVWWQASLSAVWSFLWFETAHGTVFHMTGYNDHNRDPDAPNEPRMTKLDHVVMPIFKLLKLDPIQTSYSWVSMGLKGFLIGLLPLGWYSLALAVLWPSAYWLGRRYENSGAVAEYLSGMAAGTIILLAIGG